MDLTGIFKQIEEHTFTSDKCFLCGCLLTDKNKTEEHVIPKWLQRKFNLWNQNIILLNGTNFPYRYLTIPCCFECNNRHLEPLEKRILNAFNSGFESFSKLEPEVLFLWLGKIYFGILYKELFVKIDRTDPASEMIHGPGFLDKFYAHFLFLQGIRKQHKFKDFFPASIFLFKTKVPESIHDQWDFRDSYGTLFISMRMGEIGVVCVLQDGQSTQQFENDIYKYCKSPLHPLQFSEISAEIYYKAHLMNRIPKYINVQRDDLVESMQLSLQGLSTHPIFDKWDDDEYAKILSEFTGVPLEQIRPDKYQIWTSLPRNQR